MFPIAMKEGEPRYPWRDGWWPDIDGLMGETAMSWFTVRSWEGQAMGTNRFTFIVDGDMAASPRSCPQPGVSTPWSDSTAAVYIDFEREVPDFAHALSSAITTVESTGDLRVRRVEPDDLDTVSAIADRLAATVKV